MYISGRFTLEIIIQSHLDNRESFLNLNFVKVSKMNKFSLLVLFIALAAVNGETVNNPNFIYCRFKNYCIRVYTCQRRTLLRIPLRNGLKQQKNLDGMKRKPHL